MIARIFKAPTQSFFLFGPRQTGKSTFVKSIITPPSWSVNLLRNGPYLLYSKSPALFYKHAEHQITAKGVATIFVDEIQRVPELLTEVHALMEEFKGTRFILTGSSARKLKRAGVDLLGGRAIQRRLYPYVHVEVPDRFDLERVLQFGSLPSVFEQSDEDARETLETYVETYLKEEIKAEGLVRSMGPFSRFIEVAAAQNGELVNFSDVGREAGLPVKTVESYFDILEDTLVGLRLMPYRKSVRKRLTAHPKFYFFDIGVLNAINRRLTATPDPVLRGRQFEHFVVVETWRLLDYWRSEARVFYWRTNTGAEVDLVIEKHGKVVAGCEIKSSPVIVGANLTGLRSFGEDHPDAETVVVSTADNGYKVGKTLVLPWAEFFEKLKGWA